MSLHEHDAVVARAIEVAFTEDVLRKRYGIEGKLRLENVLERGDRLILETPDRLFYSPVVAFDHDQSVKGFAAEVFKAVEDFLSAPTPGETPQPK